MISRTANLASVALARVGGNEPARFDWAVRLGQVDVVLFWGGLLVFACLGGAWLVRGRRDPLAGAPLRENTIPIESLIIPLIFLALGASLATPLLRHLAGDAAGVAVRRATGSAGQAAGALACLAIGGLFVRGGLRRFLLGDARIGRGAIAAFVGLLVALPLCSLVLTLTELIFARLWPAYPMPDHDVILGLRDPNEPPWAPIVLWIGAVIVAPIAEESFFRGLVQTVLGSHGRRRWAAVVVTSILFGFAHASQWQVVPALALLGLILGVLYERSGMLFTPILLHALFNLKTLVWESYGAGGA